MNVDWQHAYQILDPQEPIPPAADDWYCERPEPPLERLIAALRLRRHPGLYLVSGHVGTGKTTELLRLVESVSDTHQCFLDQVELDLWRGSADENAFLAVLTVALKALAAGRDWKEVRRRRESAATIRELSVGMLGVKARVVAGQTPENANLFEQLVKTAERVRLQRREPLIVLDGFDKIALADLERLLTSVFLWSALPVSVVLTVPLSFLFTPMFARSQDHFASTAVVPAIRVTQQNGESVPAGHQWMRSLLSRRGVGELFAPDALDQLISQTGGIIRDFLRVARESVLTAHIKNGQRVTREYAADAVTDFSLSMSRAVSPHHLRLLYAVHRTGQVIGDTSFLELIGSGQIIEYRNGSNWYAVHPLLREAVQALGRVLESEAP